MTYSVDDLVATLGANHIGQEAMDLAALQVCLFSYAPLGARTNDLSRKSFLKHWQSPPVLLHWICRYYTILPTLSHIIHLPVVRRRLVLPLSKVAWLVVALAAWQA